MNRGVKSSINRMLIEIFGVPKKYKGDPFSYSGYYSLIYKWQRSGYQLKYIYYCVLKAKKKKESNNSVTLGYIIWLLKNSYSEYLSVKDSIVIDTPEDLFRSGYTHDMLPEYMFSKKEREFFNAVKRDLRNIDNNVSKEDVESLKEFLGKL